MIIVLRLIDDAGHIQAAMAYDESMLSAQQAEAAVAQRCRMGPKPCRLCGGRVVAFKLQHSITSHATVERAAADLAVSGNVKGIDTYLCKEDGDAQPN